MNKLDTVNFHNELGHSPLTSAASHGYLEAVKLLVKRGANVNMTSDDRGNVEHPYISQLRTATKRLPNF